jgi:hypothetical protein
MCNDASDTMQPLLARSAVNQHAADFVWKVAGPETLQLVVIWHVTVCL